MILERFPRWPFGLGALILGGIWLYRRALQDDREAVALRDAWATDRIADALAEGGAHSRERLRAAMTDPRASAPDADPEVRAWIDAQGLRVELAYEREKSGAREVLVVETLRGRRVIARSQPWDELPSAVRGRFLSGETRVVLPWRTPWPVAGEQP